MNRYDRWLTDIPEDNRTDEEIEDDAAETARERKKDAARREWALKEAARNSSPSMST